MSSIVKNKEIYDPAQGNPFESIEKFLEILDKQILDTTKLMQSLESSIKDVSKTSSGIEAKGLSENIEKLNTETEKLNKLNSSRKTINDQIEKSEKDLVSLYDAEAQQLSEVKLELQERRAELKKTAKENKVAKDSIVGLNIQLSKLRQTYDKLSKEQRENEAIGGRLLKQIDALDKETKQLTATTGRFQKNVGNYPKLVNSTTISFKGLGRELLAAGGVVGGIQLLIEGFKLFASSITKNSKVIRQLQTSFDLTRDSARGVSASIIAIADTFDEDYNEVLKSAISVSKQLGIGVEEATSLIEEGFLKGSNNSGEFLDILKEYPAQFKAAGIDAEQAFAIINQQVTEGIYSDKGVDAIKEGGLRLRENTKAVQAALAPLAESTRLQIQQEVAAGRSFEAIKLVSEALNDTSLTAAETQAIIADVFGGAGEDAGLAYLQTLKDIDSSLEDVAIQSSESEQASLRLSESWNNFSSSVGASEGVFTTVWASIKSGFSSLIDNITTRITNFNNLFSNTEAKALKLQSTSDRIDARRKIQAQTRAEQLRKEESAAILAEQNRRIRFEKWKKDQAVVNAANNKRLRQVNSVIDAIDRQIEKIDELTEVEEEKVLAEIDSFVEKNEQLAEIATEFRDVEAAEAENLAKKKIEIQEEFADQSRKILESGIATAGEFLGEMIAKGELSFRAFGKSILKVALDITEKFILLSIARITANEIGSKSFAGIATAAVLAGLVKITFSRIKSSIAGFAEGTEYVQGPGTGTSDSIPAMLSKGERVVPAKINKMLGNIDNDNLPNLIDTGLEAGSNSNLAALLESSNSTNKKMLAAMHKVVSVVPGKDGMNRIYRTDGSPIEEYKPKS